MKHAEVNLGHEYLSRVSGELVRVKVLSTRDKTVWRGPDRGGHATRTVFRCLNTKTGKEVIRSAAALRPVVAPRIPHPNAEVVARLVTAARCDRLTGHFDRGQATRELILALASERTEGPRTRIARQTLLREFGVTA